MKPNVVSVNHVVTSTTLTALPTAKIVRHPRAKKAKEEKASSAVPQPDQAMVEHLNAIAKKFPFCVQHRTNNRSRLL